jgi:hypothetical protein
MPKCNCGKKFHACGSCGLSYEWEWRYCSEKCYQESNEFKRLEKSLARTKFLVDNLRETDILALYDVLSDDVFSNHLLEYLEGQSIVCQQNQS